MSFIKHVYFYASEKSIKFNNPQNLHALPETELAILVANHLLGKLATTSCYIVDKNCTGKQGDGCCCGVDSCRMTGEYGDTSIGKYIAVYINTVLEIILSSAPEAICLEIIHH